MCYKVSTPTLAQLQEYLKDQPGITINDYEMYYHADGFNRPFLPVTLNTEPHRVQPAQWKLIPHWVKTQAEANKYANTLNATCEDIFEKATYRSYIGKFRCLLWVNGFYEPNHPKPKESQPWYVYRTDGQPFSIGCVFAPWTDTESGEIINTISIITVPANELLTEIHNEKKRMPLIIPEDRRTDWLGDLSKEQIIDLMKPLPDGHLKGHPVTKEINKYRTMNVPEIQNAISLNSGSLF